MNYFIQAFQKIFTYQGRARRAEYGWFMLTNMLLQFGSMLTFYVLVGGASLFSGSETFGGILSAGVGILGIIISIVAFIYGILTFFVVLSLTTRRLHDLGWSGWWQAVVYIIPILWLIILFMLLPIIEQTSLNPIVIVQISSWLAVAVYFVFNLILLFKDGQKHPNKYGESPKYPTSEPEVSTVVVAETETSGEIK